MKKRNDQDISVYEICLGVFGVLTASVTHELKNTLSIINENAGLLEDLCVLADGEADIPAEHVEMASQAVVKQVHRSSTILKNLNSYAHSGDTIPGRAELSSVLQLMEALTARFAALRKITLQTDCRCRMELRTNLLVLESLLFLTLKGVYESCPEGSVVVVEAQAGQGAGSASVKIRLAGGGLNYPGYPGLQERILAAEIGAACSGSSGELVIELAAGLPTALDLVAG